jgi:hypothetical protein
VGLIKFLTTADTGSNKPEKFAVQAPAQAYWYERPTGYRVAVLKPKLDRLSVTFSVHHHAIKAAIRDHLSKLAAGARSAVTPWQKRRDWGSQKYDRAYALKVAPGRTVLVQCSPLTSADSLLRFEFNPNGIGPGAVKAFRQFVPMLTAGHFDYPALATQGKVTRLDIAVDLVNIDIEDLLIATPKPGVTKSYFGLSGKVETKYLNVNKKGSRTYVYDRRALLDKLNAEGLGELSEFGTAKYTRVEVRTEVGTPITAMANMSNRLLKLDLFDIEAATPPEQPHHWRLFQDSCRYRGLAGALALLPEEVRSAYQATIKSAESLWRATELWGHWPAALKTSGLTLPADGCDP